MLEEGSLGLWMTYRAGCKRAPEKFATINLADNLGNSNPIWWRTALEPLFQFHKFNVHVPYIWDERVSWFCLMGFHFQAPYNLRMTFGSEIQEASSQAAELVRDMGRDISNVKQRPKNSLLKKVHSASERLQRSTELHAYMLTSTLDSKPLPISKLSHAHALSMSPTDQMAKLDPQKNSNRLSYHEMRRRQSRRLYSWPSREVDAFHRDNGTTSDLLPRMISPWRVPQPCHSPTSLPRSSSLWLGLTTWLMQLICFPRWPSSSLNPPNFWKYYQTAYGLGLSLCQSFINFKIWGEK